MRLFPQFRAQTNRVENEPHSSGSNNVKVTLQKDGYDMDLSYETAPAGVTEVSAATLDSIKELDHVQKMQLFTVQDRLPMQSII